ncbi:2494_t:CDS:10, partial [Rhizophagus irregularis]
LGDFPITIKENIGTHLARTSGNILQVNDNGNIKSIVKFIENLKQKKIEENLKQKKSEENLRQNLKIEDKKPDGKPDRKHNIYCDVNINFKPIVSDKEPWVLGDYERTSYCLYYNKKRTLTETLQLIVGRSTVQIWHQINDENKLKRKKEHLPNKGEPFLEYIWTNRIPVNQESEETRLQISKFECEPNDSLHDKLRDFYLKVYWYEVIEDNVENLKETEHETSKEDNEEIEIRRKRRKSSVKVEWLEQNISMEEGGKIDKMIKHEKVIKRKDIIEKFHAIRHACKALEHLNKRYKSKFLANNYIRVHEYEEMISYIKHIVWRYAKNDPENFKLLDVRHNVMKNLILGDCDHLIKFILFKDEEENTENKNVYKEIEVKEKREKVKRQEFEIRHIPRDNLWPEESFLKDDDLDFYERKDNRLEDNEKIKPRNNMELAIYHCKGRELKDTIIVAYFLEYYSRNATDCAGWMNDYARKLFFKECFADQDHFSAHDPDDIIPIECRERRNHDIKFRAFKPLVRLESNKYKWYNKFWNLFKKSEENLSLKHKIYKSLENFDNDLGKSPLALRIVPLPIIFYYLAFYQLVTEALQFHYRGFKKYFDEIFNSFDIISIVLSVTVMSIMFKNFQFSDGFGSVKVIDTGLIAGISFSIFFLWIELILYLRIISDSIKIKESTYSGIATNDLKNETLDIKLKSDFDPKSSDNPYSLFSDAIIATYFWIGGNWAQRDEFDFWAIDVFSLIASIFLVIVLQNMLIAFMNGIYTTAETKEEWYATRKDEQGAIYKDFEEKSTFTKRTYKERDYDKYSILVYEEDIKVEIEKIKNMKNDVNVTIEYLIKKLYDIKKIMEDIEKNINDVVERLLKKLDKSN